MEIEVDGLPFTFVCDIEPARDGEGRILEFMPQARYKDASTAKLNRHGQGPFCQFKFPRTHPFPGVYAVTVARRITYIGECANLSERWGPRGYASIQPKNCYTGGQSTNCKINSRILGRRREGQSVQIWFYRTNDYKAVELSLRAKLTPEWNAH